MAYHPRHYQERLSTLLKGFPIVCILGPRQCGKTTFVQKTLENWRYLDLEKPSDFVKVVEDPEDALNRWQEKIIFDEAEHLPTLFPILRSFVDQQRNKKGRVILLGSVAPGLIQNISESLAGRVGFLDMSPFLLDEVKKQQLLWFRGGFPDAYLQNDDRKRRDWFEAYTRTFIERDLNQLGISVSSAQMRKLWAMLAHVHGGLWNASDLGASLGVNYHTVNRYLDILEHSFLIRRLEPYYANIGKRFVKSPKIYFRDSGLLHYFLGIENNEILEEHPKRGMSWEGFAIEQILGFGRMKGVGLEAFFWKPSGGTETDLLLKKGKNFIPIEIKLHTAPTKSDIKGLVSCMKDLKIKEGFVLRPSGESYSLGEGIRVVTIEEFLNYFSKIASANSSV